LRSYQSVQLLNDDQLVYYFHIIPIVTPYPFNALTVSVGQQEGYQVSKKFVSAISKGFPSEADGRLT